MRNRKLAGQIDPPDIIQESYFEATRRTSELAREYHQVREPGLMRNFVLEPLRLANRKPEL